MKVKIPLGWQDITFSRYAQSQEVVKAMPESVRLRYFEDKGEANEADTLRWMKMWVQFWTGLTDEQIGKARMYSTDDEIGLADIYLSLVPYIGAPDNFEPLNEFEHKGVKYRCIPENFEGATFDEYWEGEQIKALANKMVHGELSTLPHLCAMYFRKVVNDKGVEPYHESRTVEIAKEFENLTMDKLWSAHFFLFERNNSLVQSFARCLQEEALNQVKTL